MNPLESDSFFSHLDVLPFSFWIALALCVWGGFSSVRQLRSGVGLPMLAVLGTVATWYFGDAFYNDYANYHVKTFSSGVLDAAWMQVAVFIGAFLFFTPACHRWINGSLFGRQSHVLELLNKGTDDEEFQNRLTQIFYGTLAIWLILVSLAWLRLGADIKYYLFPYLGEKAEPWSRGRVGSGSLDALIALAGYLQIFVGSAFGIIAALSNRAAVRGIALIGCFLTWPYYLFDRTRNTILATTIPGILGWTFLRLRASLAIRIVVLIGWFFLVETWLHLVMDSRVKETSVTSVVHQGWFLDEVRSSESKHEGLNMFEELCWMNTFMGAGAIEPNWGQRYFAELVNPIPRALWPGKPMIGIDYALARGMGGGEDVQAGLVATASTGLIGQSVQNFGGWLGPPFAGFLMALWVAALARLDLQPEQVGAILLYLVGLVLTFNLGRDITLLTLYPFFFGWLLMWGMNRRRRAALVSAGASSQVSR